MLRAKTESRHSTNHKEAMAELNKQPMHRITIDIEKETFLKFKAKLVLDREQKSVNSFFRESVNQYLKK